MKSLLLLIFAHLLADYPLQGDFLSAQKGKNWLLMTTHCGIWTGCICIAGHFLGWQVSTPIAFFLFGTHFAIDEAKCSGRFGKDALGRALQIDQLLHLGQLIIFWVVSR